MPYCPHCRKDVLEEVEHCPTCRRLLLPQRPAWRPYDTNEPLVSVCTVYSELQALLLKGQLEQEGIPAVLQYEAAGRVFPVTVDGLAKNDILVPESLAAEAAEVLAAYQEQEGNSEPEIADPA